MKFLAMTIVTLSLAAVTTASANIDLRPADAVKFIDTAAVPAKPAGVTFAQRRAGNARKTSATAAPAATAAERLPPGAWRNYQRRQRCQR
jgi:hypothetical protein